MIAKSDWSQKLLHSNFVVAAILRWNKNEIIEQVGIKLSPIIIICVPSPAQYSV